ncbi:MAG: response regulator transcription factor [Cohaesibacter sp.]|nr:response regulator transcription factor [Cohaesibacter sp.]
MMKQNLLIVEDDPFHLKFIEDQLKDDAFASFAITTMPSGDKAWDWLTSNTASFAIIDLNLPGKNGVEIATRLWQSCQSASIVFWSNFSDPAYVRAIAKIVPGEGNFGYILKTMSGEKCLRSLKGVLFDGQRIVDGEVQGFINRRNTRSAQLNQVESDILNLIALGLTDRAISDYIGMSQRSIQLSAAGIFDKLSCHDKLSETDDSQINKRSRLVARAFLGGEINRASLLESEKKYLSSVTTSL